MLVIPAAWPFPRLEHWRVLTMCRAIEQQVYVIACNRVGTDGPLTFCGSSALIDPYGTIRAAASPVEEKLIIGEIDRSTIDEVRARMTVLTDRRPDVYEQVDRCASPRAGRCG